MERYVLAVAATMLFASPAYAPPSAWIPETVPPRLCADLGTHRCSMIVESHLLATDADASVRRDGRVLTIVIDDDREVAFHNRYRMDHERGREYKICDKCYYYVGRLPSGEHLLSVVYYEGFEYRILHPSDGREARLGGAPLPGPVPGLLACTKSDYESSHLEVWRHTPDGFWSKEASLNPGPVFIDTFRWSTPEEIEVLVRNADGSQAAPLRARLDESGWSFAPVSDP